MPNCQICNAPAKEGHPLCYSCFKKEKINPEKSKEVKEGLDKQQWSYRYNMIKGRIAETLIQELFLSLGFNVFNYGMENTIPGIMELLKGIRGDVAAHIRRILRPTQENCRILLCKTLLETECFLLRYNSVRVGHLPPKIYQRTTLLKIHW